MPVAAEAHELERLADETRLLGLVDLPLAEAIAHVPGDVHVREQRVVLEDRVDVAPVGRHAGDRLTREEDLALGRLLEPGDHPERRGLAAARRAKEAVELTVLDAQVHPVDRDHLAEALGHVEELDVGDRRLGGVRTRGLKSHPGGIGRLWRDGDGQRRPSRSVEDAVAVLQVRASYGSTFAASTQNQREYRRIRSSLSTGFAVG